MVFSDDFDDFFSTDDEGASAPEKKEQKPKEEEKAQAASGTDDELLSDFGDFDELFEEAEAQPVQAEPPKTETPPKTPQAPEAPKKDAPSSGGDELLDDLLSDFDEPGQKTYVGDEPVGGEDKPSEKPQAPPKAPPAPPATPAASAGEEKLDDLFDDFLGDGDDAAASPSQGAGTRTQAAPPPKEVLEQADSQPKSLSSDSLPEASGPDDDLEELFSEVSEAEARAPEEAEEDAMGEGIGIEYKSRKRGKGLKKIAVGLVSVVLLLGGAVVGLAYFTDIKPFGLSLGKKSDDGYIPPSPQVLRQLNEAYLEASKRMDHDTVTGYTNALKAFEDILKQDPRHAPTDARWAEATVLVDGGRLPPAKKKKVDEHLREVTKHHPSKIETIRAKARVALAVGKQSEAASLAKRAFSLKGNDPDTLTLQGELYLKSGELESAIAAFENALKANPNLARAKHFLATAHIQNGSYEVAEALLRELMEASPPHPSSEIELWNLLYTEYEKIDEAKEGLKKLVQEKADQLNSYNLGRAWNYIAEIAEAEGKKEEAVSALEMAVRVDGLNHVSSFRLGKLYLEQDEFAKAEKQFGRASSLSPDSVDYLIYHGWALREVDQLQESLKALDRAIKKSGRNVEAHYQQGLTRREMGRVDEAIVSFETVLKNDPQHLPSMIELGELYLQKDNFVMAENQLRSAVTLAPNDPRARNAMGELLLVRRKPEDALKEFQQAEEKDKQNVVILSNLGKAYLALGNTKKATQYFEAALNLDPSRIETKVALGELQHKKGEYTKALDTYRGVLEQNPKDYATRVKLAKVLIDQQAFGDAVNELKEASKYKPDFFETRLQLGIAYRGVGDLDSSLAELDKAVGIRPEDREGYYQTQLTHIFRNDPYKAETVMESALQRDPEFIKPLIAMGEYYDGRNLYSKAIEYYERASNVDKSNASVYLKVAQAYRAERKFKEAEKYFQRTLKYNKKSSEAYVGLGLIAEDRRDRRRARAYFVKAAKLDPNDPRPYYYLGFLYKDLNMNRYAIAAFSKYLELDPESKERKDIEDQILALKRRR